MNKQQVAELWNCKMKGFLGRYPEDVRKDWEESLRNLSFTTEEDGIKYRVILNPGRAKRLEIKQRKDIHIPKIGESIQEYKQGKDNTNLAGEEYSPFYALINIFPIEVGHVNLCYKEENPDGNNNIKINRSELKAAIRFSRDTGYFMWRNTKNAGMTIPNWRHLQGISCELPIRYAKKEVIDRYAGIYHMPDYSGSNILFQGEKNLERVLSVTDRLHNGEVGHPVVIDGEDIYVFAVRDHEMGEKEFGLEKSLIGGFEAAGHYVALSEQTFNKFVKGEITIKQILRQGMYSKKDIDLYDLVK